MRSPALFPILASSLFVLSSGSPARGQSARTRSYADGTVEITPCGPNVVRVRIAKDLNGFRPSLAVVNRSVPAGEGPAITTSLADDGSMVFSAEGKPFLASSALTPETLEGETVPFEDRQVYALRYAFRLSEDEALYGFGQFPDGFLNWRGHSVKLAQRNVTAACPMFLSTAGYGVLWDNNSYTTFEDKADGLHVHSELGDGIDYYVIYGPSFDAIIAAYRQLTGAAPLFPRWAYGYWQSKERYKSFAELIDVVKEYRARKLPLDVIVQDWRYWGDYGWSAMKFDEKVGVDRRTKAPTGYPDPADNIAEIHELHAHLLISIWPCLGHETDLYKELKAGGYILVPRQDNKSSFYDAYDSRARAVYWKYVKRGLFDYGIDGWWLDCTEPVLGRQTPKGIVEQDRQLKASKAYQGSGKRYFNSFPLVHAQGLYENQRKATEKKRVCLLTRAAFLGQQRYATVTWSGDIHAGWDVFKKQIPAGLNFCAAGLPYWTTDTGGFFVKSPEFAGGCENEAYRELYTRWFQFSTFCPILRSHGTSTPREIWRFGEPGQKYYETLAKFDRLRYRLLPYVYSLAHRVTADGYTILRALAFDFPRDPRTYNIADQFLFGPAFMACPVTDPGVAARDVYLPPGTAWYDFWTGEKLNGGKQVEAPCPIDRLPLFVRAGSIVPLGPVIQYASEKPADPIVLRIYPGADGSFRLYEDEGDNYNYEKGGFAVIDIRWDDAQRTLTIGRRTGGFPGMLQTRTFVPVVVSEGRGVGLETATDGRNVSYNGSEVELKL